MGLNEMKPLSRFGASAMLLVLMSCSSSPLVIPESEGLVIQAYVYAGEDLTDIRITSTVPIDADTNAGPPVNDALVSVRRRNTTYNLVSSPGDSGYYQYLGSDFAANPGDTVYLSVAHEIVVATSSTVVPTPPVSVKLSSETLLVQDFSSGNFQVFRDDTSNIMVSWANTARDLHYVVVDNMEENPESIYGDTDRSFKNRLLVSQPTDAEFYRIRPIEITHIGRHRIRVYRVNQEYADLYIGRQQDSRDLNEPPSNIENALGVFSAFASDSVFFTAERW
jgi:hypothetical protein